MSRKRRECLHCAATPEKGRELCAACYDRHKSICKPLPPAIKVQSYPCGTCGMPRYPGAIHHCAPCAGCGVPSRGARIDLDSAMFCVPCYRELEHAGLVGAFDIGNPAASAFMTLFFLFLQDERGGPISPAPDAKADGRGRGRGSPLTRGANIRSGLDQMRKQVPGKKHVDNMF